MSFEPKFQGNARFEVRRLLGEGGMGAVYEVIDHDRGARVALKVLSRMSPVNVEQFKQEFRSLAGVLHPSLVRMHELVADHERCLFTMDLVDGVPFIQYVRTDQRESFPTSPASALTRDQGLATIQGLGAVDAQPVRAGHLHEPRLRVALAQLVAGVHAIHHAGKVHRDIKHSNVLVDGRDRLTILDFGLITDAAASSDVDAPGGVWGTPAYMSPEQAAGKVATAASDWYAVGVMLYEALTGRLPFAGRAHEVLLAKQRAEPVPPSAWVRQLPADLEALCLRLLRFRPEDRPHGSEILRALGVVTTELDANTVPSRPPFVGRAMEIEALCRALQTTPKVAQAVIVEGLSGMGKSALVDEVLSRLRRSNPELLLLAGRCYARESVPFKAFDGPIEALSQYLHSLNDEVLALLTPPGIHALTQMFPALLQVPAFKRIALDEPVPADPKELRRRAFTCLRALLDRVARHRPLLIYVDDLQWGDEDSAHLWTHLLTESDPPAASWLCTFRSDERNSSPCLRLLLSPEGITERVSLHVEVTSLSAAEMNELARGLLPAELLRDAQDSWMHEARGNPFFALELAREISSRPSGPSASTHPITLEQALAQRVSRLPRAAQRLLQVVSVAARPLDPKAAFTAAGLGYDGLSCLTELHNAHLTRVLGPDSNWITAYHDRIRETVTEGLAVDDVRAIHGALADAIEARGDADPELLTEHLVGAGDLSRAARYAAVAAEQAARALAFGRAARLYELALSHTTADAEQREHWQTALAEALVNAGRGADAARVYLDAARESSAAAATLRRLGAEQLILSGHIDEGITVLGDELRACGLGLPEPGQALAQTMTLAARLRERGLAFSARDPASFPTQTALRLEVCWAVALGFTGSEPERLMPIVLQHLLDALDAGSTYHVLRALCLFIGNGATATRPSSRTIATALAVAETLRTMLSAPDADAWVAQAHGMVTFLSHGDAAAALPCFERAEDVFRNRCRGVSREIGMAQVGILASLADRGRIAEYNARYPMYLKDAEERSDLYLTMYHRSYHAAVYYLASDDAERAWSEVDAAVAAWGRKAFDQCALFSLLSRLEILLYQGGPSAHAWATEHGPEFLGSILATGHYFRARFFALQGRAAVMAAIAGGPAHALLSSADQALSELKQSELKIAPTWALALGASIEAARGRAHNAMATLDKMVGVASANDDALSAACARVQLARLMGAESEVAAALSVVGTQGIVNPSRWATMQIPLAERA